MKPEDVIERLLSKVVGRAECFQVAMDRGEGKPRNIENWILVEMTAELRQMKADRLLDLVDGEHQYHDPDVGRVDLWWQVSNIQHWVEVKTVVLTSNPSKSMTGIKADLTKLKSENGSGSSLHELVIVFPISSKKLKWCSNRISEICGNQGFINEWPEPALYSAGGLGINVFLYGSKP
jgi:hypothetical protein